MKTYANEALHWIGVKLPTPLRELNHDDFRRNIVSVAL